MASTFRLDSYSYEGRYMYLSCTQTRHIESNTSTINWTLTVTGGSSNYYTTGPTTVIINGITVYYKEKVNWDDRVFPAAVGSVSGSTTVQHDVYGNATIGVSLRTNIYLGLLETKNGTWALDSNPRFAEIISAPNFNDDESPTITYSNPAGNNVTSLDACISLNGNNADIAYRPIDKTGTSYTFNLTEAEKDVLRSATTGSNSRSISFHIRTVIGSSTEYRSLTRTFTINNPKPVINPLFYDSNDATFELTNDRTKLIKYYSNVDVTIGAYAVKKANLTSSRVYCGSDTVIGDGTINGVSSSTFTFYADDDRGNTTVRTVTPVDGLFSFVDYIRLSSSIADNKPDVSGNMTVTVTGNYFNGSFGAKHNNLVVKYRYKSSDGSYPDEWNDLTVTLNGNTYSATADITGLDYTNTYIFQACAVDELSTVYSSERSVKSVPVFDWSENDFNFNVPTYFKSNIYDRFNSIICNGNALQIGSGESAIDPNTTTYELCLTDHANCPSGQGNLYFIRTMVSGNPSVSITKSQTAIPCGIKKSIYHRTMSNGIWTAWQRSLTEDDIYVPTVEYTGGAANAVDPNTTTSEFCLTDHANGPSRGHWYYIQTIVYGDRATSDLQTQIAVPCNFTGGSMYHRTKSSGVWTAWRRNLNEDENFTKMELVWENASPNSGFGGQLVTYSKVLDNYHFVLIEFNVYNTSTRYSGCITSMITRINSYGYVCCQGEDGTYHASRNYFVGPTQTQFFNSCYSHGSGATDSANLLIPIRIYGIKGLS